VTAPAGVQDSEKPEPDVADRPRPSTEFALFHVVHVVLDEAWSPKVAANRLLKRVDGDLIVLRRARARVLGGATERPTAITERALATLALALARRNGHEQTNTSAPDPCPRLERRPGPDGKREARRQWAASEPPRHRAQAPGWVPRSLPRAESHPGS
jgi:hypothetical protein